MRRSSHQNGPCTNHGTPTQNCLTAVDLRHELIAFMQDKLQDALREALMEFGTELRAGVREDIRDLLVVHPTFQSPSIIESPPSSLNLASVALSRAPPSRMFTRQATPIVDLPSQQISHAASRPARLQSMASSLTLSSSIPRGYLSRRLAVETDDVYSSETETAAADHPFGRRPIRAHPETLGRFQRTKTRLIPSKQGPSSPPANIQTDSHEGHQRPEVFPLLGAVVTNKTSSREIQISPLATGSRKPDDSDPEEDPWGASSPLEGRTIRCTPLFRPGRPMRHGSDDEETTTTFDGARSRSPTPLAGARSRPKDGTPSQRQLQAAVTTSRDSLNSFVTSSAFENIVGAITLLYSLCVGYETNSKANEVQGSNASPTDSFVFQVADWVFAGLFLVELILRLCVHGVGFFWDDDWYWNYFDLAMVFSQIVNQMVTVCLHMSVIVNESFLRLLAVLRLLRIIRLVRMLRLSEELRTIVISILSSMLSLFWTLLFLMMIIYMLSVLFTQVVLDVTSHTGDVGKLSYWYGNVGRTFLTFFECIAGGVSWDDAVQPLNEEVSPLMGVAICCYVAFCVFAVLNMATGVFVDRATRKAQEDKDTYTANHISDLFFKNDECTEECISWEKFANKMSQPSMKEYFKAINVDPSEAGGLFKLLDADGSGYVDAEEVVNGCLRLRGPAKALELSLLMYETTRLKERFVQHTGRVENRLDWICQILELVHLPPQACEDSDVMNQNPLLAL